MLAAASPQRPPQEALMRALATLERSTTHRFATD